MNAGIVVLKDGTPCIVFDDPLPPVGKVIFTAEDHLLTLVFEQPDASGNTHRKLEYPLEPDMVDFLKERGNVAVGMVVSGALKDIRMVNVVFS
ncbi:MAG: hypothetical protein OXT65_04985 [Alphaproteobacteria bacterium]|nr:hypothetical protein [Alphaproteobacteria bacterium]